MSNKQEIPRLALFPLTAEVNARGHLVVGGCSTLELAAEFGTPLYVFDEFSLRSKCREYKAEFGQRYADTAVIYAGKASINGALTRLFNEEGLGLDVVSAGELSIAQSAGFPLDKVYFHGNNKSAEELRLALNWHIGRIVVDNFYELKILDEIGYGGPLTVEMWRDLEKDADPVLSITHARKFVRGLIDGNMKKYPQGLKGD